MVEQMAEDLGNFFNYPPYQDDADGMLVAIGQIKEEIYVGELKASQTNFALMDLKVHLEDSETNNQRQHEHLNHTFLGEIDNLRVCFEKGLSECRAETMLLKASHEKEIAELKNSLLRVSNFGNQATGCESQSDAGAIPTACPIRKVAPSIPKANFPPFAGGTGAQNSADSLKFSSSEPVISSISKEQESGLHANLSNFASMCNTLSSQLLDSKVKPLFDGTTRHFSKFKREWSEYELFLRAVSPGLSVAQLLVVFKTCLDPTTESMLQRQTGKNPDLTLPQFWVVLDKVFGRGFSDEARKDWQNVRLNIKGNGLTAQDWRAFEAEFLLLASRVDDKGEREEFELIFGQLPPLWQDKIVRVSRKRLGSKNWVRLQTTSILDQSEFKKFLLSISVPFLQMETVFQGFRIQCSTENGKDRLLKLSDCLLGGHQIRFSHTNVPMSSKDIFQIVGGHLSALEEANALRESMQSHPNSPQPHFVETMEPISWAHPTPLTPHHFTTPSQASEPQNQWYPGHPWQWHSDSPWHHQSQWQWHSEPQHNPHVFSQQWQGPTEADRHSEPFYHPGSHGSQHPHPVTSQWHSQFGESQWQPCHPETTGHPEPGRLETQWHPTSQWHPEPVCCPEPQGHPPPSESDLKSQTTRPIFVNNVRKRRKGPKFHNGRPQNVQKDFSPSPLVQSLAAAISGSGPPGPAGPFENETPFSTVSLSPKPQASPPQPANVSKEELPIPSELPAISEQGSKPITLSDTLMTSRTSVKTTPDPPPIDASVPSVVTTVPNASKVRREEPPPDPTPPGHPTTKHLVTARILDHYYHGHGGTHHFHLHRTHNDFEKTEWLTFEEMNKLAPRILSSFCRKNGISPWSRW